jgi:hypothetical protein
MRDGHITAILERAPFASLDERELATVRAHAATCADCLRAYKAARVASLLVKERAAETFEPSPFFQTRVLATLRERQAAGDIFSFARLWRSANALVASMAAVVALLACLTFFAPDAQSNADAAQVASASNPYSPEDVILARDGTADDNLTNAQVLATVYGADEGDATK